jgi:transposase
VAPEIDDRSFASLTKPELVGLVYEFSDRLFAFEKRFDQLRSEGAEQSAENATLRSQIETLGARIKELEARLSKDSHNSSKPPSSDGYGKKPAPKSLRQKGARPSGGQPGHPGKTLEMVASPTAEIVIELPVCSGCGADLRSVLATSHDKRQVFDLPPLVLGVTQYNAERKSCPCCGLNQHAAFAPDVTQPAQYGPEIKALAVYLSAHQLLPWKRTTQLLSDIFGCSLSEGALQLALQQAGQALGPVCQTIKEGVTTAPVAHFDESGVRIDGKLNWIHVACTQSLTHYETHKQRGGAAFEKIGILTKFTGTAIHDGFASYWAFGCAHGLCNGHHLRELIFLEEQYKQKWATAMKNLLLKIKKAVDQAKSNKQDNLSLLRRYMYEQEYGDLIKEGYRENPPTDQISKRGRPKQSKGHNLVCRLDRGKRETLAFMTDFSIPFDNNLAERDIRMIKVRQKISGCFRTPDGADLFNRIRSYISTMRKQGHNPLDVLKTVALGEPATPLIPAPT